MIAVAIGRQVLVDHFNDESYRAEPASLWERLYEDVRNGSSKSSGMQSTPSNAPFVLVPLERLEIETASGSMGDDVGDGLSMPSNDDGLAILGEPGEFGQSVLRLFDRHGGHASKVATR
jgi:hypothetical protein